MKKLKKGRGICKCGGIVIFDDADLSVSHSVPTCEWFDSTMARYETTTETVLIDRQGNKVEPS